MRLTACTEIKMSFLRFSNNLLQVSVHDFKIVYKTYLILVLGVVPLNLEPHNEKAKEPSKVFLNAQCWCASDETNQPPAGLVIA